MAIRRLYITAIISLIAATYTQIVFSAQKGTIIWAKNSAAPFYISKGKNRGTGFSDLTQKMIISQMPKYRHRHINMPIQRVEKSFRQKERLCFSAWIYQSRRDIAYTTIPNIYYSPLGVITLQSKRHYFADKDVSLDSLLQDKRLTFGKAKGRGYGTTLDAVIERYEHNINFRLRVSNDTTMGILRMIQAQRLDYTLDYPSVLRFYEKDNNIDGLFTFIPVVETANKGTLGAVACTGNEWEKSVIKDINLAILKVRNTPEYRKILNDFLIIPQNKIAYWQAYQEHVLTIVE